MLWLRRGAAADVSRRARGLHREMLERHGDEGGPEGVQMRSLHRRVLLRDVRGRDGDDRIRRSSVRLGILCEIIWTAMDGTRVNV